MKKLTGIDASIFASKIKDIFKEKKYTFFEKGNYNLNIIGIRTNNSRSNYFDDRLLVVYKKYDNWIADVYKITTDPGIYYMDKPINPTGTAHLAPGQYKSAYILGNHKGIEALVQQGKNPVKVYRVIGEKIIKEDIGWFGINHHRAHPNKIVKTIDKYSAGCQVWPNPKEFEVYLKTLKKSQNIYGNFFTYTLLTQEDLNLGV